MAQTLLYGLKDVLKIIKRGLEVLSSNFKDKNSRNNFFPNYFETEIKE